MKIIKVIGKVILFLLLLAAQSFSAFILLVWSTKGNLSGLAHIIIVGILFFVFLIIDSLFFGWPYRIKDRNAEIVIKILIWLFCVPVIILLFLAIIAIFQINVLHYNIDM